MENHWQDTILLISLELHNSIRSAALDQLGGSSADVCEKKASKANPHILLYKQTVFLTLSRLNTQTSRSKHALTIWPSPEKRKQEESREKQIQLVKICA